MMRLTWLMRTVARAVARRQRLGSRASTAPAWTTRSGHVSASSSTKRAIDVSICHGSTPRSLRADASERRPSRAALSPIPTFVNQAISRATVGRGVADLGVGAAHDPGDADRPVVGVADQQVGRGQAAGDVVERRDLLAVAGPPDAEAAAAQRRQVVGVVGLAELEHHVVADVDDVVDRAHPGRGEALGHPRRRRPDGDAADDGRREAAAAVAVDDLDRRRPGRRRRPSAPAASGGVNATPSLAARSRATPT